MSKTGRMIADMNRRNALRLMALTGAAGVFAPALPGRGAAAQTPEAPKGRIIVGVSQEPTTLNPLMPRNEVDDNLLYAIFDPLFVTGADGTISPHLALEVPSQENGGISEDGLEWRIRLRDDVKWHDGTPSPPRGCHVHHRADHRPGVSGVADGGAPAGARHHRGVSPTEITWRMERPFSPYLSFLSETFITPRHAFKGVADPNEAPFNSAPIGTGPFRFANRTADDHIELRANTDYFGDPDVTDRLHSGYIPTQSGRGQNNAQFRNAEVDALLEKGAEIFDPEARREIYFRVQEIVREELPFLPIFSGNDIRGWKKDIQGVTPNPNNRAEAWDANAWFRAE